MIYLNLPRTLEIEEGAIEFNLNGYGSTQLEASGPKHLHSPKRGEIILFPSSLFHRTLPFISTDERLVVSFDLFPPDIRSVTDKKTTKNYNKQSVT